MTGQTVATARWRALDRVGEDKCRLARTDSGWLLVGHARFHDADGFAALDYVVRGDTDWRTINADIAGTHSDLDVRIRIERDGAGWHVNKVLQPGLDRAIDVDFSFTPATNLMPLRRLSDGAIDAVITQAAWLDYPAATLQPLDQTYSRLGEGRVHYRGEQTEYVTELVVDDSCFVTRYPGLWAGEITHATP
jgi:hypothetical protein